MTSIPSPGRRHPRLFIAAMVMLGCVAFTFFLGTPMLVALMAQQWGFTPSQVGFVVTADTAGNTLGSLAIAVGIRGWPIRRIMTAGMLAIMGGNALIAAGLGLNVAIAGGLVAGLGNGVVSSTAIGFLVYTAQPQRNIGIMVVCQNLYAMVLMGAILPTLGGHWMASGGFLFISAVATVCVPAMLLFSSRETIPQAFREGRVMKTGVYLTLLSLYAFYTGAGVIWTFLATLGESAGLSKQMVGQTLTIANTASLAACFLVQPMARHSLYGWSLAMVAACGCAALSLTGPLTAVSFGIGAGAFVACWTLTGILLPTITPLYDPVGRHAALTPAVLGLGYATGSLLGGLIAEARSPATAFSCATACIGAAALILVAQRVFAGRPPAAAPLPAGSSSSSGPAGPVEARRSPAVS